MKSAFQKTSLLRRLHGENPVAVSLIYASVPLLLFAWSVFYFGPDPLASSVAVLGGILWALIATLLTLGGCILAGRVFGFSFGLLRTAFVNLLAASLFPLAFGLFSLSLTVLVMLLSRTDEVGVAWLASYACALLFFLLYVSLPAILFDSESNRFLVTIMALTSGGVSLNITVWLLSKSFGN